MNLFGIKVKGKDKVLERKKRLHTKLNETLKNYNEKIKDELNKNSQETKLEEFLTENKKNNNIIGINARRKKEKIKNFRDKSKFVKTLIAEGVKDIVFKSLPLDEESLDQYNDLIKNNTTTFLINLMEEDNSILNINKFLKNSSADVRKLTETLLIGDPNDSESKAISNKIASIVKSKTEKAIKNEIENAETVKNIIPKKLDIPKVQNSSTSSSDTAISGAGSIEENPLENNNVQENTPLFLQANNLDHKTFKGVADQKIIKESKEFTKSSYQSPYNKMTSPIQEASKANINGMILQEKNHLLGKRLGLSKSVKRKRVNSTFGKFFHKSVRDLVNEGHDISNPNTLNLAAGNATILYCILESLNTMNIIKSEEEKRSIVEKLLK